jgi:serine/threonine protein kinase
LIDVWSLGVLTFELSTGVAPFTGENESITRNKISKVLFLK